MNFRTLASYALALAMCTAAEAGSVTTNISVNGSGTSSGGNLSATGTVTLSGLGTGTLSSNFSLVNAALSGSAPLTLTITSGSTTGTLTCTLKGSISLLAEVFAGVQGASGAATITVNTGTGGYAGTTGTLNVTAAGTGSGTTAAGAGSFTLTGSGTLSIPGATGGGGGGGGGSSATPPSVTTLQNNFGLVAPGLPNYGIAPGALFFIQGTNLAGTTSALLSSAAPGLQTTVSGVGVSVTVGSTTLPCVIYYISPTQIDAILPDATPLGTGTVKVTNGTVTGTFAITVVQSAFGILSYHSTLAAAYDGNNNILTTGNSANIGQEIVLWGSGVGGDPNNDDKVFPQKQNNLTSIPMTAYVGGIQATINYRGRSQYPGVDQVVLTIPGGVTPGCYVSLAIVSGNIVSNWTTIPVAASGSNCPDPVATPQTSGGSTSVRLGGLIVSQTTSITAQGSTTTNTVGGTFESETTSGFSSTVGANTTSIGSCVVYVVTSGTTTGTVTTAPLDAGPSINVSGPAGSITLSVLSIPGAGLSINFYAPPNGTAPSTFIPATGGAYTFDNGSGGKDVGHFNSTLNLPASLVWTNAAQITSVSRSQGVTVTWTGGASAAYVTISGSSANFTGGQSLGAAFTCEAPVSAGTFTVPVPVLLSLPSGTGELSVATTTGIQQFTASGLDYGYLIGSSSTSKSENYQ